MKGKGLMEYCNAGQLSFDPRLQISRILTDELYQILHCFSRDRELLTQALSHIFVPEYFYTATQNDMVNGFLSCTDGKALPVRLCKKTLCGCLGLVRGWLAHMLLKSNLLGHTYPFELSPQTGSIQFVTTAPEHRRKGVAYGLITHAMEVTPYKEYVLEVEDANDAAIRLYKKLGFKVLMRKTAPLGSGSVSYMHIIYQ